MLAIKNTSENTAYITEQDYLEGEKIAEVRHEYVDGVVYAMAGTSLRHNDIAINITSLLRPLTRGTPCKVNASDSTIHKDYMEKSLAYQSIASLQAYLVVAQDKVQVDMLVRLEDGSWGVRQFDPHYGLLESDHADKR